MSSKEKGLEREAPAMPITSKRPLEGHSVVGSSLRNITVLNNFGEKLVGILHETGSQDLVILCHGFRSTKDNKTLINIADALTREGISAFRFDFAGNGESEGSFQYGNYRREVEDLRTVVLHFCSLKHKIVAIIGHSKGGNVVLLYASKYHDVYTVVNISGRYALDRGIEGRLGKEFMKRIKIVGYIDVKDKAGKVEYRVTEENLMDRLQIDMCIECHSIDKNCSEGAGCEEYAEGMKTVICLRTEASSILRDLAVASRPILMPARVLTVHGSEDVIVPVEDAIEFAKIIPNHKLFIIEGANHVYNSHLPVLASTVVEFIKADHQQECKTKICLSRY